MSGNYLNDPCRDQRGGEYDECEHGVPTCHDCTECMKAAHLADASAYEADLDELDAEIASLRAQLQLERATTAVLCRWLQQKQNQLTGALAAVEYAAQDAKRAMDERNEAIGYLGSAQTRAGAALEAIERLGHTAHCAARMAWGDGECECKVTPREPRVELMVNDLQIIFMEHRTAVITSDGKSEKHRLQQVQDPLANGWEVVTKLLPGFASAIISKMGFKRLCDRVGRSIAPGVAIVRQDGAHYIVTKDGEGS